MRVQWCESDARCKRLTLSDLLVTPMQHAMRMPLLLEAIVRHTPSPDARERLQQRISFIRSCLSASLSLSQNFFKIFLLWKFRFNDWRTENV